jgi:hypothetical protein
LLGAFRARPASFDRAALRVLWMDDVDATLRTLFAAGLLEPSEGGRFALHALLSALAAAMLDK